MFSYFSNNGTTNTNTVPIFHVSLHEVGHILKLSDNNETNTVMYKALIPVHHDITDIDKARAHAAWGRSAKKEKQKNKTLLISTTNTNSIKYHFFNVAIIFTTIIILLLVVLIVAACFAQKKSNKRRDSPENNSLVLNGNSF